MFHNTCRTLRSQPCSSVVQAANRRLVKQYVIPHPPGVGFVCLRQLGCIGRAEGLLGRLSDILGLQQGLGRARSGQCTLALTADGHTDTHLCHQEAGSFTMRCHAKEVFFGIAICTAVSITLCGFYFTMHILLYLF